MEFTPVFVGGGWRGGTTVLHALICTSPRTNDFINECSYFASLVGAYAQAVQIFDGHSKFYFRDRSHMADNHAAILKAELERTWEWVGRPEILALKSPPMTKNFGIIGEMIPNSRFVVTVRDPRDVIASRIKVLQKQNRNVNVLRVVQRECSSYNALYDDLLAAGLGDKLCVVEYERLVAGDISALATFGFDDIDPAQLWESKIHDIRKVPKGGYLTELYGAGLSNSSVGNYEKVLSADLQKLIVDECGGTVERVKQQVPLAAI